MTRYAQLTLGGFNAEDAKIIAIRDVEQHADPVWMRMAKAAIEAVCATEDTFTTDAVWGWLSRNSDLTPHEPRAMGAAMRDAQARGLIQATGKYEPSERILCHARPLMVWRSVARAS